MIISDAGSREPQISRFLFAAFQMLILSIVAARRAFSNLIKVLFHLKFKIF